MSVGTALAASAGRSALGCALLAATLLSGQLSIGWCNDFVDRERDVANARADKPLATGVVSPGTAAWACALAAGTCVVLSLAGGLVFGLVHLLAVAGGWAYDLGVKRTRWSFVPYAVSFGLLPSVATLSLVHPVWAPWWATTAGALLGVAAHLANALPDLADDEATGVLGLPTRLGAKRSKALAAACLGSGAGLLAFAPPGSPGVFVWCGLGVSAALLAAAFAVRWPQPSRAPFALTVAAAVAVVGLLLARGTALT